ncbi:Hypp7473 [Branchiostoma lanceolatum]|uniref:Hypp7473 protein n=1 Tax=Branchiostoma lanceolatum TaxID=7740 RepID=A0A8J9Z191_BRALA|nr:Hypp7473 [Branchiostoma lanceolatum]
MQFADRKTSALEAINGLIFKCLGQGEEDHEKTVKANVPFGGDHEKMAKAEVGLPIGEGDNNMAEAPIAGGVTID